MDTIGLNLAAVVNAVDIRDRDGSEPVLESVRHHASRMRPIRPACGYAGKLAEWVDNLHRSSRMPLEIVERMGEMKGFKLLPYRWVVERAFACWAGAVG